MLLESLEIPIASLVPNTGQIPGVPTNPRTIKDGKFRALMQSIKDNPEMLKLRELIVFPLKKSFVVLGGNMRLSACIELGHKHIPCKVLNPQTPAKVLKEIIMKDNIAYGETDWDLVANEWDTDELEYWGMDLPKDWGKEEGEGKVEKTVKIPVVKFSLEFTDLDQYQQLRSRIEMMLPDYPACRLTEK